MANLSRLLRRKVPAERYGPFMLRIFSMSKVIRIPAPIRKSLLVFNFEFPFSRSVWFEYLAINTNSESGLDLLCPHDRNKPLTRTRIYGLNHLSGDEWYTQRCQRPIRLFSSWSVVYSNCKGGV